MTKDLIKRNFRKEVKRTNKKLRKRYFCEFCGTFLNKRNRLIGPCSPCQVEITKGTDIEVTEYVKDGFRKAFKCCDLLKKNMKGIREYFKDIIELHELNPPKNVYEFAYAYKLKKEFLEKELLKTVDVAVKIWDIDVSYYDAIHGDGSDDVVLVRRCFSTLIRSMEKNGKKRFSFEDIGNFLNKKPHTIMYYCSSVKNSPKKKQLYNIFLKQYEKIR